MQEYQVKSVISVVKPWDIECNGKAGSVASVNGHKMQAEDRVVVRGIIQEGSALRVFQEYAIELQDKPPIKTFGSLAVLKAESGHDVFHYEVTLDWDGKVITEFPEPRYARSELARVDAL